MDIYNPATGATISSKKYAPDAGDSEPASSWQNVEPSTGVKNTVALGIDSNLTLTPSANKQKSKSDGKQTIFPTQSPGTIDAGNLGGITQTSSTSGKQKEMPLTVTYGPYLTKKTGKSGLSRAGTARQNVTDVLKQLNGDTDSTSHIFDNISDDLIEKNYPYAEEAVGLSKARNAYGAEDNPLKTDALALAYASDDAGNKEAAKSAWKVANTPPEQIQQLLLSTQPLAIPKKQSNNSGSTRYVGDNRVRLRTSPGLTSGVLGSMNSGDPVIFTGNKTEEIDGHLWAEVIYNGKKGWVAADYLKISNPIETSTHKQIAGSSTKNNIVSEPETENTSNTESNDAYHIINNSMIRYVGDNNVRLRSSPGLKSDVLDSMKRGTAVNFTGNKTEKIDGYVWAEIEYNGKKGWVAADYLKTGEAEFNSSSLNNSQNYLENLDIENNNSVFIDKSYVHTILSPHQFWKTKPFSITIQNGEEIIPSFVVKLEIEHFLNEQFAAQNTIELMLDNGMLDALHSYLYEGIKKTSRPHNIPRGTWARQVENDLKWIDQVFGKSSLWAKTYGLIPYIGIGYDTYQGVKDNLKNENGAQEIATDIAIDIGFGALELALGTGSSYVVSSIISGTALGSVAPGIGNILGALAGTIIGILFYVGTNATTISGKSVKEMADEAIDWGVDGIRNWIE